MDNEIRRFAEQKNGPDGQPYLSLSFQASREIAAKHKRLLRDVEIQALKGKIIPERYQRNLGAIGIEGQIRLLDSKVAVAGAGGLGGHVLELLARWGIGRIVVIDGDTFVDSNLNRQVLSNPHNLGQYKAEEARQRGESINPSTEIEANAVFANGENLAGMLRGCQILVDGLDNIAVRLVVEKIAKQIGIPLVHGAIAGFMGQVMTIFPEDKGLELIYGPASLSDSGVERVLGAPCVTPAVVAGYQVMEVIKILLGWSNILRNRLLAVDLKESITEVIDLEMDEPSEREDK